MRLGSIIVGDQWLLHIKHRAETNSAVQRVADVDMADVDGKINRGGIIPYIVTDNDNVILCMGVDRNSGDLSDFGGRRKSRDGSIMVTLIRECTEESLGKLKIHSLSLMREYCVTHGDCLIIFARVDIDEMASAIREFESAVKLDPLSEMSGVEMVPMDELNTYIDKRKVYKLICPMLKGSATKLKTLLVRSYK